MSRGLVLKEGPPNQSDFAMDRLWLDIFVVCRRPVSHTTQCHDTPCYTSRGFIFARESKVLRLRTLSVNALSILSRCLQRSRRRHCIHWYSTRSALPERPRCHRGWKACSVREANHFECNTRSDDDGCCEEERSFSYGR